MSALRRLRPSIASVLARHRAPLHPANLRNRRPVQAACPTISFARWPSPRAITAQMMWAVWLARGLSEQQRSPADGSTRLLGRLAEAQFEARAVLEINQTFTIARCRARAMADNPNAIRRPAQSGSQKECARPAAFSGAQNIVLALADVSGIGWITSQCSTTLPCSRRKMSTTASPRGLSDRPCSDCEG
jgi:hypothetical protein